MDIHGDLDSQFLDQLTDNFVGMPDPQARLNYVLGQIEYIGTLGEQAQKLSGSLRVLETERDRLKRVLGDDAQAT